MKLPFLFLWILVFGTTSAQTIDLQSFATGFSSPVDIAHAPNDSRLFVVQKGGLIRIVQANGTVNATPFLTVTGLSNGSEQGLLGLAFHPNYATNGLFFINYTNTDGDTVIARYSVSSTNPDVANPTGTILMTIDQPYSNHNGGSLKFGPDGYLYIGMGDGGSGGDPQGYAQNLTVNSSFPSRVFLGKMLRIDVNTGTLYGIPSTNPYAGQAGKGEIWAIGLRNPWKFSFNKLNGDLWIADVGQNAIEEVNKTAFPLPNNGLNYGWNCYEGNVSYSGSGSCPLYASTVAPVSVYLHASTSRCSITGGYFYTGTAYPNFNGKYFFGDYCTAEIAWTDNTGSITWAHDASGVLTTFGEDSNGELYAAINSTLYKIIDTSLDNDSFNQPVVKVFPNPTQNSLTITVPSELKSITISDMLGKKIYAETVAPQIEHTFDISNLSNGMYFITIETQTGLKSTSKIIKQ